MPKAVWVFTITTIGWTAGYTWYEACGGVSIANIDNFKNLDETKLKDELNKLTIK